MNTSPVNLRNLEQIHEGSSSKSPRLATLLLAATGAASVLVVGMAMRDRAPAQEAPDKDPLAALVANAEKEKKAEADLQADELDFPDVLSDADSRTTALVAVKDRKGRLIPHEGSLPDGLPPETEQLAKEQLPAGTLLASTSVTKEPKDQLSQIALSTTELPDGQPLSEPGSAGGFTIQVASFKNQDDADGFVTELRKRGHKAFRQAANVPDRGIWHRVRIGSFKTKYSAELYKKKLEKTERTIALVIDPAKVERAQQVRAANLAERIRKFGSQ